jgi:hypothetical protein
LARMIKQKEKALLCKNWVWITSANATKLRESTIRSWAADEIFISGWAICLSKFKTGPRLVLKLSREKPPSGCPLCILVPIQVAPQSLDHFNGSKSSGGAGTSSSLSLSHSSSSYFFTSSFASQGKTIYRLVVCNYQQQLSTCDIIWTTKTTLRLNNSGDKRYRHNFGRLYDRSRIPADSKRRKDLLGINIVRPKTSTLLT